MYSFVPCLQFLQPAISHIFGLAILAWIYVGWAFIGYIITQKFGYYFFNPYQVGYQYVGGEVVDFTLGEETCESLMSHLPRRY